MGQALITRRGVPMLAPDVDDGYDQLINYTMLYDSGDECEEVTGGFTALACRPYDSTKTAKAPTLTKNADSMKIVGSRSSAGGVFTGNTLDLSEYNKAAVIVSAWSKPSAVGSTFVLFPLTRADKYQYPSNSRISIGGDGFHVSDVDYDGSAYCVCTTAEAYSYTITHLFLVKPDDIASLCGCAGLSVPADLTTLIGDTEALTTIFSSKLAVDFMTKQCTGDFMLGVVKNATALGLLQASPYYTEVQANEHWTKFLAMVA